MHSGRPPGVIAFYALRFPQAKLAVLFRLYFWFRWIRYPAWVMFVIWFALQLLGTIPQLDGTASVSYLAHLGGAATGILFYFICPNGCAPATPHCGSRSRPRHAAWRP